MLARVDDSPAKNRCCPASVAQKAIRQSSTTSQESCCGKHADPVPPGLVDDLGTKLAAVRYIADHQSSPVHCSLLSRLEIERTFWRLHEQLFDRTVGPLEHTERVVGEIRATPPGIILIAGVWVVATDIVEIDSTEVSRVTIAFRAHDRKRDALATIQILDPAGASRFNVVSVALGRNQEARTTAHRDPDPRALARFIDHLEKLCRRHEGDHQPAQVEIFLVPFEVRKDDPEMLRTTFLSRRRSGYERSSCRRLNRGTTTYHIDRSRTGHSHRHRRIRCPRILLRRHCLRANPAAPARSVGMSAFPGCSNR